MARTSLIAEKLITDLQRDFGLTKEQAVGVAGNLAHESAGFQTLQEVGVGGRGGFGYAQWTGPRRRKFEAYARDNKLDPESYEANYGFMKHELETDPYERKQFMKVKSAKTAEEAALSISKNYLRPGTPRNDSRLAWANQFADLGSNSAVGAINAASPQEPVGGLGALAYQERETTPMVAPIPAPSYDKYFARANKEVQSERAQFRDNPLEVGVRTSASEPNAFEQAIKLYPSLSGLNIHHKSSPGRSNNKLEFWPPGEEGSQDFKRPSSIPIDGIGIETYEDVRPLDILGDIVSHQLVNSDEKIKSYYRDFEKSLTNDQKQRLGSQYMYARENYGETRTFDEWKDAAGLPAYFRGYAFKQWDNPVSYYTKDQMNKFDGMMEYLESPQNTQVAPIPATAGDKMLARTFGQLGDQAPFPSRNPPPVSPIPASAEAKVLARTFGQLSEQTPFPSRTVAQQAPIPAPPISTVSRNGQNFNRDNADLIAQIEAMPTPVRTGSIAPTPPAPIQRQAPSTIAPIPQTRPVAPTGDQYQTGSGFRGGVTPDRLPASSPNVDFDAMAAERANTAMEADKARADLGAFPNFSQVEAIKAQGAGNGLPQSAAMGTIMRGTDGKNYQFAETTGMGGGTGSGWIETTMDPTSQNPNSSVPFPMARIQRKGALDFGGTQLPGVLGLIQRIDNAAANASGTFGNNYDNFLQQAFTGNRNQRKEGEPAKYVRTSKGIEEVGSKQGKRGRTVSQNTWFNRVTGV